MKLRDKTALIWKKYEKKKDDQLKWFSHLITAPALLIKNLKRFIILPLGSKRNHDCQ
jgi:hypothetical protein